MNRAENTPQEALSAYVRVSTSAQAESGLGLEAQRRAIRDYARTHGLTIAAWHEDAGRSGASLRNRDGLRAALEDVRAGRSGGLIVAKVDRLGRSAGDVASLVERAHRERWRVVALDVGLDLGTPAGELVANALGMAARFEWRRISERQAEKHEELRRQGRPRGRPAVARDVADRIRALRSEGLSFAGIAERLNDEGVATARGGGRWYAASVRSALLTRERELAAQAA
jgi:DNA invertase Pin-like site-specific DNA recombinase